MKIFLHGAPEKHLTEKKGIIFVDDILLADVHNFSQFLTKEASLERAYLSINDLGDIFCIDTSLISKRNLEYFRIGNINEDLIEEKIVYFFENLWGIALYTLSKISNLVKIDSNLFKSPKIGVKDFLGGKFESYPILIANNNILSPSNLNVSDSLYELYNIIRKKLDSLKKKDLSQVFFEDFILSLLPVKYWTHSLFLLNSTLKLRVCDFYNTFEEKISLHVPIARSKFAVDFFESLLLQTNKNFNLFIGIDGYTEKQKNDILMVVKQYKDRFENIHYFVNKKNLGVGKTRWKLLNMDKKGKYIMFLDDDVFLSNTAIEKLYTYIKKYPNMGIYSIANVDVKYNVNYKDYIFQDGNFEQPGVFTNRERVNRLPLYCDQEETPLIHDRYYSTLLNIKYNKIFNKNSIDVTFNRLLEIICGNIDITDIFQFNRIGHRFHQTREKGYSFLVFNLVVFLIGKISRINNNVFYYDFLIKTLIPKQNELFTQEQNAQQ